MLEQMQIRLEELKKEFEIGHNRLQETERQQALLRETLLRISGAIQVLEEVLANSGRQQDGRLAQDEAPVAAEQKKTSA